MPLWLISSNLFGIPLLNSGLSHCQREKYRLHHLFCVILLRNIPLFVIQCYFMFNLGIYSAVVIITFLATMFSVAVCAVMMLDFYVINKRKIELPFTINVHWEKRRDRATSLRDGDGYEDDEKESQEMVDTLRQVSSGSSSKKISDKDAWWRVKEEEKEVIDATNPLSKMGRRKALAEMLEEKWMSKQPLSDPLSDERVKIEVMATTKQHNGFAIHCAIAGLGEGREPQRIVKEIVAGIEREELDLIRTSVMEAMMLKNYTIEYDFTVTAWSSTDPSELGNDVRDTSGTYDIDATSPKVELEVSCHDLCSE